MESNTDYKSIDVKIQLVNLGENYTKRIPAPVSFETLQTVVKTCIKKANPSATNASFRIRYEDIDGLMVVVDDDSDLEIAYTLCLTGSKKICFLIEISNKPEQQQPASVQEDNEQVEEAVKGKKPAKSQFNKNGLPRKALKQLIQSELMKQAKPAMNELLKDKDLGRTAEDTFEESKDTPVQHVGVECDGCGENPIVGVRYKCSVLENFDYCAACEERLGHEYPFLKIRQAGGAPDVMLTFLDENQPGRERGGHRGRGGRGRGGCRGGRGGHGGQGGQGGFGKIINSFLKDLDYEKIFSQQEGKDQPEVPDWCKNLKDQFNTYKTENANPEKPWKCKGMMKGFLKELDLQKVFHSQDGQPQSDVPEWAKNLKDAFVNFQGCKQEQPWKNKRASLVKMPEGVLEVTPDQLIMPELEIFNGTYWPWKAGCCLSIDDDQDMASLVCEMINVPVNQEVKGQQSFKIQVPIQIVPHAVAEDRVHELRLCFRGPNGNRFGQTFTLKLKVVRPMPMSETVFYEQALKLHEMKLGSFDECVAALKANNYDVGEAMKKLQSKH